jgi:hypothetical protein
LGDEKIALSVVTSVAMNTFLADWSLHAHVFCRVGVRSKVFAVPIAMTSTTVELPTPFWAEREAHSLAAAPEASSSTPPPEYNASFSIARSLSHDFDRSALASNAFKYGCQPAKERPTQYRPAKEYNISKSKIGIMKAPRRTVQPWCLGSWFICSAEFTRP